jgi:hypothetical protein
MCPYQGDANWLELKVKSPDERIRQTMLEKNASTNQTVTSQCYLHPNRLR